METAVIKTGGKQYIVSKGLRLNIEKLPGTHKEGDKVVFEEVLMVDNGSDTTIGDPLIKGAKVSATILEIGKAKKIDVVKYKAKSRYYKRRGHRQPFVKVEIDAIS
jgi:large subunit ribosomal protein L21